MSNIVYLDNEARFPVFKTCSMCFALVDLAHLNSHSLWHSKTNGDAQTDVKAQAVELLTTHRHGEDKKPCNYCMSFYGSIVDKLIDAGIVKEDQ